MKATGRAAVYPTAATSKRMVERRRAGERKKKRKTGEGGTRGKKMRETMERVAATILDGKGCEEVL